MKSAINEIMDGTPGGDETAITLTGKQAVALLNLLLGAFVSLEAVACSPELTETAVTGAASMLHTVASSLCAEMPEGPRLAHEQCASIIVNDFARTIQAFHFATMTDPDGPIN